MPRLRFKVHIASPLPQVGWRSPMLLPRQQPHSLELNLAFRRTTRLYLERAATHQMLLAKNIIPTYRVVKNVLSDEIKASFHLEWEALPVKLVEPHPTFTILDAICRDGRLWTCSHIGVPLARCAKCVCGLTCGKLFFQPRESWAGVGNAVKVCLSAAVGIAENIISVSASLNHHTDGILRTLHTQPKDTPFRFTSLKSQTKHC